MMYAYSDSILTHADHRRRTRLVLQCEREMGWDFNESKSGAVVQTVGEPYPFNKQHEPILYGDTILNGTK
jgi:hypothetical protein